MTPGGPDKDRGSTLPLYIWVTGILLFAALAFFAFAQAASARNGAQTAADAAALAAAQESRDELLEGLVDAIEAGEGDEWLDWLDGIGVTPNSEARAAAEALAAENDSGVTGFEPTEVNGYPGYWAEATTNYTVGDSIIPGTETKHAKAEATAVIKPRCKPAESADPEKAVEFTCDGSEEPIEIDPDDFELGDLPDAADLFAVHLAD
ncbi:pilus assembly protein TadG-related protein [Streptomyces lasiicapitis]|uniref:pilus assembly protein TadG-related protein n=1 Tax=Streptomyces lasiicapitis TaxID=1923961 RepID=UPI00332B426E